MRDRSANRHSPVQRGNLPHFSDFLQVDKIGWLGKALLHHWNKAVAAGEKPSVREFSRHPQGFRDAFWRVISERRGIHQSVLRKASGPPTVALETASMALTMPA